MIHFPPCDQREKEKEFDPVPRSWVGVTNYRSVAGPPASWPAIAAIQAYMQLWNSSGKRLCASASGCGRWAMFRSPPSQFASVAPACTAFQNVQEVDDRMF